MGSKSFEKRLAPVAEIHYGAERRSIPRVSRPATSLLPVQCTTCVIVGFCAHRSRFITTSVRHFEVEQRADSEHRLNAFMAGSGERRLRRELCGEVLACRRLTTGDGHVRKLSYRLYPTLVAHHPPSENWRDWATETRRLRSRSSEQ